VRGARREESGCERDRERKRGPPSALGGGGEVGGRVNEKVDEMVPTWSGGRGGGPKGGGAVVEE